MPGRLHIAAALALSCIVSGCATSYVGRTSDVRAAYETYDYGRALHALKHAEKDGPNRDRLLFLMDEGMLLHASGDYAQSIPVLARADDLSRQLDVVSIHEEAIGLLTSQRTKAYRGEDFEQLMINVLQGLNYACIGKPEDALVEERRVNLRLNEMIEKEKKPYEQLAIARYLSAVMYEDQGLLDDAFIDYQNALKTNPNLGALAEPLLRIAQKTGRADALAKLERRFPGSTPKPLGPNEGQLLVVVEAGRAPQKVPSEAKRRNSADPIAIPVFVDRGPTARPWVGVDGEPLEKSVVVTNLSRVAKVHLNDRIGRMLAKQLAGTAVKAGVAAAAGALTHSKAVGVLAFFLLSKSNKADLRSWMSLPAQMDLVRFRLPAGRHRVELVSGPVKRSHEVTVRAGHIALWVVRVY